MFRLDYLSHGQKCEYHRVEVDEETDEMEGQLDQHGVHETFETTLIVDFGRIVHTNGAIRHIDELHDFEDEQRHVHDEEDPVEIDREQEQPNCVNDNFGKNERIQLVACTTRVDIVTLQIRQDDEEPNV